MRVRRGTDVGWGRGVGVGGIERCSCSSRKVPGKPRVVLVTRRRQITPTTRVGGVGRGPALVARSRGNGNASGSVSMAQRVEVSFNLSSFPKVGEDERLILVGQSSELGRWDASEGLCFEPRGAGWTTTASLRAGDFFEFKCVVAGPHGHRWEEGENRTLAIPQGMDRPLEVNLLWAGEREHSGAGGGLHDAAGEEEDDEFDATLSKLKSTLDKIQGSFSESSEAGDEAAAQFSSDDPVPESGLSEEATPPSCDAFDAYDSLESQLSGGPSQSDSWQGREIVFMQSNDHSHDRQGLSWDTSMLAEGSCEAEIVQGDQNSPSWREKLEVVERILCRGNAEHKELLPSVVSACSIYLNWINCGSIACSEGGGHHRPCRHAESSMRMFRSLEWGLEESSRDDNGNFASVLIRRLYPLLPSFSSEFRASTPLTRIRDIAHRNDIPQDLKREIKHTIQNKLHRNAGPEDLVATEQMLERVTGEGGAYPEAFVEEFKRFTVELREFFNASSLDEQLLELQAGMGDEEKGRILAFLQAKDASSQGESESSLEDLLSLMEKASGLRQLLCGALSSGLRNDAPERAMETRQKYRLCELALESYGFTVASRALNAFSGEGRENSLQDVKLLALVLQKCMINLSLNGFLQAECSAISNELLACADLLTRESSDQQEVRLCMLRLKACLDRTKRVCDTYRDSYLGAYSDQAARLGKAFGQAIPDHSVSVFAESETRASMIFQCAKICQVLSRSVSRDYLKGDNHEWETLVAGKAFGNLVCYDTIEEHTMAQDGSDHHQNKILVVRRATGDEEVSASGDGVRGVVLMHELPHLSHLAIRARQEGVVFATCTSEEEINKLLGGLSGKYVCLEASQQRVTLVESEAAVGVERANPTDNAPPSAAGSAGAKEEKGLEITKASFLLSVGMKGSTKETCGAKAAQCGELQKLSMDASKTGIPYTVPKGVCLPFGSMELVLGMQGGDEMSRWKDGLSRLDRLLDSNSSGEELDKTCQELRGVIENLEVPTEFVEQSICTHFNPTDLLIARSSANVEDLKGMSGAGLYDSILGLDASDTPSVADGVKRVWASLYTRRAVLSRHKAGVPSQATPCMAVLIQRMVPSEYAFVLHTVDPIMDEGREGYVYAELAPGQGETLAAGTQGTPYRLRIQKETRQVEILAFANFSRSEGGGEGLVDYSKDPFTQNPQSLIELGEKLCDLGMQLEDEFGCPQDIEGALSEGGLYIVQSRPQ
ncbi:phosphoglucan water dikinase [Chloropicon primus]|uniref:Phosphoglucan water dikinase n=3 Tax=Chloropicon primus TaxID=1764295 RepID=A0A5B8MMK3_9CHLO|nr:phosphoglucan water dikinase [Chloropicon primus]UPQ99803.1 phosphoglucan water dikinase [Chloropicon primus]|eukprot:QDZ20592.1 phosphoglucan water dikinase [Chloropicon primus]